MREQLSTERESAQRLRMDVMEPVHAQRVREAESLLRGCALWLCALHGATIAASHVAFLVEEGGGWAWM